MMTFQNIIILLKKNKWPTKPNGYFSFPPFSFDLVPQNSEREKRENRYAIIITIKSPQKT